MLARALIFEQDGDRARGRLKRRVGFLRLLDGHAGVEKCVDPEAPVGEEPQYLDEVASLRPPDVGQRIIEAVLFVGRIVAAGSVRRSEERRVGKECRSRWSPYH